MAGLLDQLGQGLQTAGGILSPQVYQEQAQERQNAIVNLANTLKVTREMRAQQADAQFQEAIKGVQPGMSSSALLEKVQGLPPDILANSPSAQGYLNTISNLHQTEVANAQRTMMLQAQLERANKPTDHYDSASGKLIRSYPDGRTEILQMDQPKKQWGDPYMLNGAMVQKNATTGEIRTAVTRDPSQAGGQMDEGSLKSAGAQIATGMPISQVVPGYGTAAVQERKKARAEAIRQIKDETGMSDAEAGRELANRNIDYVAGRRSSTQLNLMLGMTRQAVSQLDFNIKQANKAMDKLPSTDISPVLNAMARGEQYWTGDPAYSELFFYMTAAAQESARILSGGQGSVAQLHEGARQEAQRWASVNMTPKSWKEGVAPAMLSEGRARLDTYQQALKKQRLGFKGTPEDTPEQQPQGETGWTDEKEKRYQELKKKQNAAQ